MPSKSAAIEGILARLAEWARDRAPLEQLPLKNRQEVLAAALNDPRRLEMSIPETGLGNITQGVLSSHINPSFADLVRGNNLGLRYEIRGTAPHSSARHYDTVGGRQMLDALGNAPLNYESSRETGNWVDSMYGKGQVRVINLPDLAEQGGRKYVIGGDPYYDNMGTKWEGKTLPGSKVLYRNDAEGFSPDMSEDFLDFEGRRQTKRNSVRGLSFDDLLTDPETRDRLNMSLALPAGNPVHKKALVLKADGGSVDEGSRARAARNAPGFLSVLGGLSDALSAGARGAVKATLGWPGELERLAGAQLPEVAEAWRAGAPLDWNLRSAGEALDRTQAAPTLFPTMEDVGRALPPATSFSMPPGTNPYEKLTEWAPATPGQAAKLGRKAVETVRGALSTLGQPVPRRLAQLGAVRLKGGNFDTENVQTYLGSFDGLAGFPFEGNRTTPTAQWSDKQLRNYITKDLGSPTDPLLQVEREGKMHMADMGEGIAPAGRDGLNPLRLVGLAEDPARMARLREQAQASSYSQGAKEDLQYLTKHAELSGGAPLTPWGAMTDDLLYGPSAARHVANMYSTDPEYALRAASGHLDPTLIEHRHKSGLSSRDMQDIKSDWGWIAKAPDAPVWQLRDPYRANETLGFDHVLDYLEAAQKAAPGAHNPTFVPDASMRELLAQNNLRPEYVRALAMHDAGLGLTPDQLQRLSVADAVRKTHEWNKLIESGMGGPKNPDLLRGWVPHKEYPDKMKWVEFKPGEPEPLKLTPEGLPEGWTLTHEPALEDPATGRPWEGGDIDTHPWKLTPPNGGNPWPFPEGPNNTVFGTSHTSRERAIQRAQEMAQKIINRKAQQELEAGLNAEGQAMGHCVGGYCNDVAERGTRIYSLRDASGNPHVTVEVAPGKPPHGAIDPELPGGITEWVQHHLGPDDRFQQFLGERLNQGDVSPTMVDKWTEEWLQKNRPGVYRQLQEARNGTPPNIVQIKGKQNAAPVNKYLPYVQDFVKNSGPWGRVGDIDNTGLAFIRHPMLYGKAGAVHELPAGFYTREEVVEQLKKLGYDGDADAYAGDVFRDIRGPRRGYAEGGHVLAPMRAQLRAARDAERDA